MVLTQLKSIVIPAVAIRKRLEKTMEMALRPESSKPGSATVPFSEVLSRFVTIGDFAEYNGPLPAVLRP